MSGIANTPGTTGVHEGDPRLPTPVIHPGTIPWKLAKFWPDGMPAQTPPVPVLANADDPTSGPYPFTPAPQEAQQPVHFPPMMRTASDAPVTNQQPPATRQELYEAQRRQITEHYGYQEPQGETLVQPPSLPVPTPAVPVPAPVVPVETGTEAIPGLVPEFARPGAAPNAVPSEADIAAAEAAEQAQQPVAVPQPPAPPPPEPAPQPAPDVKEEPASVVPDAGESGPTPEEIAAKEAADEEARRAEEQRAAEPPKEA